MIRLCYSNRFEALLDAVAQRIDNARGSLFDPVRLVIPNTLVEGRVKEGLARRLGIAANVQGRFLHHFLRDVVAATAPQIAVVDRDAIELALLSLFHDPRRLASRDLEDVRRYLALDDQDYQPRNPRTGSEPPAMRSDGPSPSSRDTTQAGLDRRRVQLAGAVAELFDTYTYARPEMLAVWQKGRLADGPDAALQRWQRELWLALFGRQGVFAERGVTLAHHFETTPLTPAPALPTAVHIFGMSFGARLYRSIFAALSRVMEVHIYALNPCREYWEDLEPRRRRAADPRFPHRRAGRQLTLDLSPPAAASSLSTEAADPALLALWGRPGRDNIRLLNEMSDCAFEERFVDPTGGGDAPTLLASVQQEILDRAPAPRDRDTSDGSIAIVPCPDPRRELETVAAEIWARLRADEQRGAPGGHPLRFSDFAVIVPPAAAATYLPLVRAVFHEASELPHTIVDLPAAADRRVAEAIELLLALPDGPLGRRDLLRLAMHPTVAGRFPDVDPADWPALCEALTIVRGADGDDHAGSYLDQDRVSWDQGLTRLALGAFLTGPRSGEERAFPLGGRPLLPAELAPAVEPGARALGATARALIAFARAATAAPAPVATFMALVRRTIAETLRPAPEDEAALSACFAAIDRLAETAPADLAVSFRVAADLLRARLAAGAGHGRAPQGVTVSTFAPMRALPFRMIFVVGLDEGLFPGLDRFGALDLRASDRRPDDVTPREQDQYLFLETLLAARERLTLSYVDRDAVTGDRRGPSSVVRALQAALAGEVPDPERALVAPKPPLARHLDDAICAVNPAAARERQAEALGRSLRRAAGAVQLPAPGELRATLSPEVWTAITAPLAWLETAGPVPADRPARTLTLADLRRFLECPMQGSVESLLGLSADDSEDEAEATLREHEALDESRVETVPMLREVFAGAVAGGSPDDAALAAVYDEAAAARQIAGRLPAGLFGAATRTRHLELLRIWRDGLAGDARLRRPLALAPIWIGAAPEHRRDVRRLPSLALPGAGGTPTTILGKTELLADLDGVPTVVTLSATRDDSKLPFREMLRTWLTQLGHAAGAAVAPPAAAVTLRLTKAGAPRLQAFALAPLSAEAARAHLAALAAELGQVHPYLLPCEGIFTWRRRQLRGERMSVRSAVLMVRDDGMTRLSSDSGPVPDPRRYPVPAHDDAEAMVARRFLPLFDAFRELS